MERNSSFVHDIHRNRGRFAAAEPPRPSVWSICVPVVARTVIVGVRSEVIFGRSVRTSVLYNIIDDESSDLYA